jgi:hypothetical protein
MRREGKEGLKKLWKKETKIDGRKEAKKVNGKKN